MNFGKPIRSMLSTKLPRAIGPDLAFTTGVAIFLPGLNVSHLSQ